MNSGSAPLSCSSRSSCSAVVPVTRTPGGGEVAQPLQGRGGRVVGRPGRRDRLQDHGVAAVGSARLADLQDPRVRGDPRGELVDVVRAQRTAAKVGDDEHRGVEAGAEALGEQVVRLALRAGLVVAAGVGELRLQRQRRCGEGQEHDGRADEVGPGPGGDAVREPPADRRLHRPRCTPPADDPPGVDAVAEQREQGGQQRQGGGDGEQHDDGRGEADRRQHADARQDQRGHGHDHRDPGEGDRGAGRAHRRRQRLPVLLPGGPVVAVAGDDEQGVVDADAEPDHRGEDRRPGGDVECARQQGDAAQADADGDERHHDRARAPRRGCRRRSRARPARRARRVARCPSPRPCCTTPPRRRAPPAGPRRGPGRGPRRSSPRPRPPGRWPGCPG